MKKIPTIFERDWEGDRSRVLQKIVPECGWVFDGEGVATRKYDGTPCLVEAGVMFKRISYVVGKGDPPAGFRFVELQKGHGKNPDKEIGWVPVDDEAREDRWFREAADFVQNGAVELPDGTYELVGPKVNGNPEGYEAHTLVLHADAERLPEVEALVPGDAASVFEGLVEAIAVRRIEGVVWHHPDGRMAKIKGRDFGLKR